MKKAILMMVAVMALTVSVNAQSSVLGTTGYNMVPAMIAGVVAVSGAVVAFVASRQSKQA